MTFATEADLETYVRRDDYEDVCVVRTTELWSELCILGLTRCHVFVCSTPLFAGLAVDSFAPNWEYSIRVNISETPDTSFNVNLFSRKATTDNQDTYINGGEAPDAYGICYTQPPCSACAHTFYACMVHGSRFDKLGRVNYPGFTTMQLALDRVIIDSDATAAEIPDHTVKDHILKLLYHAGRLPASAYNVRTQPVLSAVASCPRQLGWVWVTAGRVRCIRLRNHGRCGHSCAFCYVLAQEHCERKDSALPHPCLCVEPILYVLRVVGNVLARTRFPPFDSPCSLFRRRRCHLGALVLHEHLLPASCVRHDPWYRVRKGNTRTRRHEDDGLVDSRFERGVVHHLCHRGLRHRSGKHHHHPAHVLPQVQFLFGVHAVLRVWPGCDVAVLPDQVRAGASRPHCREG